jgi:hypothetical protein
MGKHLMSFVPTAFRPLVCGGWGGRAAGHWRGKVQTDNLSVCGRTVINRGEIGTNQYRSTAPTINMTLAGVSRDSAGSALGSCTVELYHGKKMVAGTVSDASGNYSFSNPGSGPFRIIADKAGVAGVTAETLTAV